MNMNMEKPLRAQQEKNTKASVIQGEDEAMKQWFEDEFKKTETIDIPGGRVEVLDIMPREIKHTTPVLFISGYGDGSPAGSKTNILEILKQGRRAIVIKSPHGV